MMRMVVSNLEVHGVVVGVGCTRRQLGWLRGREVVAGRRGAGRDGFVAFPLAPF